MLLLQKKIREIAGYSRILITNGSTKLLLLYINWFSLIKV
jgi:hypothetical protein